MTAGTAHLLRGVDGGQGLGAALVVAVLAGDLRVVLRPLLHEHLVNAPAQGGNGHRYWGENKLSNI